MKTKFKGILTLLLAFTVHFAFAQKTVTGTVSDETGALPGVNVLIKGTSTGTETDFDGKYSIEANQGDILQFSYVGMNTVLKTVGAGNTYDVTLAASNVLEQVVITALGIKREKQALGYAVAKVGSEKLAQKSNGDIARVLSGKASGVQIKQQSGMSGSGTSIIIRGMSSFSGSNQPLFIVDGVPFSGDTNAQGDFQDGNNGSSRFLDIDPNNIEEVSILKGLSASTLYGTEGRNGVVLITTKSGASQKGGAKKTAITVSSSVFFNEIASLPNYQNEYGGGFDQSFGWYFSNWGPSFEKDGPAGWGNSAAFDADGTLAHPYSTASAATGIPAAFPEFTGARYAYKPYNGVADFFRTGVVQNLSVNARGSSSDGKTSYNANFSTLGDEGFTPGNELKRTTFSLGGSTKLSNKFTVNGTLNFAKTNFETPPVAASYGSNVSGKSASIFGNLFYTPRSVDLMGLPFQNPIDGSSVYYRQNNSIQHPLWTVANAKNLQNTNRVFGGVTVAYAVNDNLNLSYRYGIDTYSEDNTNYSNKGGKTGNVATQSGIYETWNNTNMITDHNLMLSGSKDITDSFDFNYVLGGTLRNDSFIQNGTSSTGQQVFGVLKHFNFAKQDEIEDEIKRNILGVYAQTEFGYNNYLYLTLAARKDWVSNLTKENNSILYPSASLSIIPSKMIQAIKDSDIINYLKLRAGYGTSANFPGRYPVSPSAKLDTQYFQTADGVNYVTTSNGTPTSVSLGNPDLKPELIGELEFGIESRFLKNRLSLDASIYQRKTENLLVKRPLDPASGYSTTKTNIGLIENNGIEVDLSYDIFKNADGFNWNAGINWFKNRAIVEDLGLDTDMVVYAGFSNLGNAAIKGEPLGTMVGSAIARDDDGNLLVDSAGSYITKNGANIIGDATPDFNLNYSNGFSYKNLSLDFLFSWTQGGDIYAKTVQTLLGRGVVAQEGVDRANSFILPGVNPNGDQNITQITNARYYFNNILYGPNELGVYDATVYRLQEVSLSYSLSSKMLKKLPFGALSVSVSGNNLWFFAPNIPGNTNFDPNVAGLGVGNGAGFEYLNAPTSKRYGVSIKASF